jgi:hypothetical protein
MGVTMNRRLLAAAVILALGGCTSASDMLKRDPVFYGHTSKSPRVYAECVADAWQRQGEKAKLQAIDHGFDVTDEGMTGMTAALRVQQWANGEVEIRMSARSTFGTQNLVQAANLCM